MVVSMFKAQAEVPDEKPTKQFADERLNYMLQQTDDQLKDNNWLASPVFSVADIMSVYGVTTQRYFGPQVSLAPYQNILRWLGDCSQRKGYKRAMQAGDPEMQPLLGPDAPKTSMFEAGGTTIDFWKK